MFNIFCLHCAISFLPYDPNFDQRPVCSPGRDRSFPTLGAIFRLSVPELRPFVKKKPGWRVVRLPPPHCEGTQRMIKLHSSNKPLLALYWRKTWVVNNVDEKNIEIFLWIFNIFSSLCHFIFSILQKGWFWLRGVLLLFPMVKWQRVGRFLWHNTTIIVPLTPSLFLMLKV